jgi:hypothetical protein
MTEEQLTARLEYDASCESFPLPEPFSTAEEILTGDDCPKYTARDMQQAVASKDAKIQQLMADAANFHMSYRMRCDEETKDQAVEIERLRDELLLCCELKRQYQEQAAAERERCAKLVEEQESFGDPVQCWFDVLAAKIRKEPNHNPSSTSPV